MTVGIAALAMRSNAIVLMADKLITHANDLKLEREETKGGWLPEGWLALYAGGTTFADAVLSHLPALVEKQAEEGKRFGDYEMDVLQTFHDAYLDVWDFVVEQEIMRPRHVTMREYREQLDPALRERIDADRAKYADEVAPDFLVCGFDSVGIGHVLRVGLDTMEKEGAFSAIGSGGDVAHARLVWQKTNADDELARVVYEVYTAKRHAEMELHVGEDFDAYVMYGNGQSKLRAISPDSKATLRTVFSYYDQTPFRIATRPQERTALPEPPADWERAFIYNKLPLPDHLVPIRKSILGEDEP